MRLISIVGPTASGKTDFAIQVALKELKSGGYDKILMISADSRQVYKEFPILSGVDNDKFEGLPKEIELYGSEIINVGDEWSLGVFKTYFEKIIADHKGQSILPILVGGTMMYHKHLLEKNDQVEVAPNENLRLAAKTMNVSELQHWLKRVDADVFDSMNNSDQNNPRRLIRYIEIAVARQMQGLGLEGNIRSTKNKNQTDFAQEFIVPEFKKEDLLPKIKKRVEQRFDGGAIEEVEAVLKKFPDLPDNENALSKLPLGFKEISDYLTDKTNREETMELWSLHEWQYAKRQLKWL
ncbi:MAG: hypothetical protein LBG64_02460 [Pseudomonadales bacterium]|jgi:tRNA dimethylallyltransferase|nr:hypothetical protein [Pseudomonadales bacterium]